MARHKSKDLHLRSLEDPASLTLDPHGAELYPRALSNTEIATLRTLADQVLARQSGARIFGGEIAAAILRPNSVMLRIAIDLLGVRARAVRAILFDKSEDANWSTGWHQDRTIAVRERHDVAGYGPWSVKAGVPHVEPPFDILSTMITMRAHLDDCDEDNAPLLIASGSHRLGRIPVSQIDEAAARLGTIHCLAHAGDIWVYATPIIHASERARRPRRRRVLQVDFSASELADGLAWLGIGGDQ